MSPLADTNTLVPLVALVITLGYLATCVVWPFKACRRCEGTGKLRSPIVRAIRLCPRCNATGLRLRIGRKAFNAYRRLHRARRSQKTNGRHR
jgi:hypothetical protein